MGAELDTFEEAQPKSAVERMARASNSRRFMFCASKWHDWCVAFKYTFDEILVRECKDQETIR